MNRPYTSCYLSCSADGHIDGEFSRAPESKITAAEYRRRWFDFNAQCVIYGAVTMALFTEGWLQEKPDADAETVTDEDFISSVKEDKYYVAVDPDGSIAYGASYLDIKGRGRHGIIHAVTAKTDKAYLAYLKKNGISYIFCGENTFDPVIMMHKLYALFGIERALISGGAYADWTFLSAGLIDQLILMFSPVADGNPSAHSVFLRSEGMAAEPVSFKLAGIEQIDGDGFFVKYLPKNTLPNE